MDVSKQKKEDTSCAGVSMYLSFESNSTLSNAAYKTLEAIDDFSELTSSPTRFFDISPESDLNNAFEKLNHIKSVKKIDQLPIAEVSSYPLKLLSQNGLQEFKDISSSTPTKKNLKNVNLCNTLRSTYLGLDTAIVDAEKPENYIEFFPEHKENVCTESEVSNLSSSAEIITSVIEKNQCLQSPAEKETLQESKKWIAQKKMEKNKTLETGEENVKKAQNCKDSIKRTNDPRNKTHHRSDCDRNLNTYLPVQVAYKTEEHVAVSNPRLSEPKGVSEIPELINKMLKISNAPQKDELQKECINKPISKENKHFTKTDAKKKITLHPTCTGMVRPAITLKAEKRSSFSTRRMSTIVKTTLNSPARKIARKSILLNKQTNGAHNRKSVLPTSDNKKIIDPSAISAPVMPSLKKLENKNILQSDCNANQKQKRQSLLPAIAISSKSKLLSTSSEQETKSQSRSENQLRTILEKKRDFIYACSFCSREFRIKSLLDAHKRSHDNFSASKFAVKKTTLVAATTLSYSSTNTQCKYCDKKFAIVHALHIHLMENCLKIPPGDKRKLAFTEMNHVEKAQLPQIFSNPPILTTSSKKVNETTSNSSSTSNLTETLIENKEKQTEPATKQMAPPTQTKLKKKAAHSGVYRTPNKNVPCHLCKQSFKNIMDYTDHAMLMHSSVREVNI